MWVRTSEALHPESEGSASLPKLSSRQGTTAKKEVNKKQSIWKVRKKEELETHQGPTKREPGRRRQRASRGEDDSRPG